MAREADVVLLNGLTLQMDMVTKKVLKVMSRVGFDYATARW